MSITSKLTAIAASVTMLFSIGGAVTENTADAADRVRIMPIGDSITFGLGETGGYRKYLDYTLRSKGIDFDMVGPEGNNNDTFTYNGQSCRYDGNHAGYSGYTIKQQYPIPSWGENGLLEVLQKKNAIKQSQPDIVLLIIGTNDMTANRDLGICEDNLHSLIDYILADMPQDGVIFMGSIPEFTAYGGNPQRVANYNNTVKKVAESYGDNVRFADVHGSLTMSDMTDDNLHPNGVGYEKMGKFWAETIEEYLGENVDPNAPHDPVILRSDFENGLGGWTARGGATVAQTTDDAAEGNGSASVSGRSSAWNGIAYSLSSKRCPAGAHISVKAKIKQTSASPVRFKVTMQYDDNGTAVYDTFVEKDVAPGEWVTISAADYVMKNGSSPVLYFETDTDTCDFLLDEVIVMESDGSVLGDVNSDGNFDVSDLVLLEKWLLNAPDTQLADWKAADLCEDDVLDVYDLCMMRKLLANPPEITS